MTILSVFYGEKKQVMVLSGLNPKGPRPFFAKKHSKLPFL